MQAFSDESKGGNSEFSPGSPDVKGRLIALLATEERKQNEIYHELSVFRQLLEKLCDSEALGDIPNRELLGFIASRIDSCRRLIPAGLGEEPAAADPANPKVPWLFDADFYLRTNPEVAASGFAAWEHYSLIGWRMGRKPHPLFDIKFYLNTNPGVRELRVEPLRHFLDEGHRHGTQPHPLFDTKWYLQQFAADEMPESALQHYLNQGWKEGKSPHPLFDPKWYLSHCRPAADSGEEPLQHYISTGWKLRFNPCPYFAIDWYAKQLGPDLQKVEPFQHYLNHGWKKNKKPHPAAEIESYLCAFPESGDSSALVDAAVNQRITRLFPATFSDDSDVRILFVLCCLGNGGGVISVLQEAAEIFRRGIFVRVAVFPKHLEQYKDWFPEIPAQLFLSFNLAQAEKIAGTFSVVVGTIYSSIKIVQALMKADTRLLPAYYIQDYEPLFFELNSSRYLEAKESYHLIPKIVPFAKTKWLQNVLAEKEGIQVQKVLPSLDLKLFRPELSRKETKVITVCAMVRPKTPRRAPVETIEVLRLLKNRLKDSITIVIFGAEVDANIAPYQIDFELQNMGVLNRGDVAALFRRSDFFLDMSSFQAFGRSALEAMACGCAVGVPGNCGTSEYAVQNVNALVLDTSKPDLCADAITALLRDQQRLASMKSAALATAKRYSIRGAVNSILEVLISHLRNSPPSK